MPTELCARHAPPRTAGTSVAEGIAIVLWAFVMIVASLLGGITPPPG